MGRALVIGLGVAGAAAARHLDRREWAVRVIEDRPSPASASRAAGLADLGIETIESPRPAELAALVDDADLVVPSPGVPGHHDATLRALAAGTPVWSELELAARATSLPLVAVTGTNGKTTVTTLVRDMLVAAGRRTVAAGNNEIPLVDAIEEDLDVVVVEAASFGLRFTETFRPEVATWLNLADDHLDWHEGAAEYGAAKARIWACQGPGQTAVANAEDPGVMARARQARSRLVTFGLDQGDWRVDGGRLVGPEGPLDEIGALWRRLPHDVTNALAAAATARAAGATGEAIVEALRSFRGLAHRVSFVAESAGVRFYDDSKATDPHATAAALAGFDSVVLIAGGRNKGLDLTPLARHAVHLEAVVAVGESAPEVEAVFAGHVPVERASGMDAAVAAARARAHRGDVVLLSPACASYDSYPSYRHRGEDFARAVTASLAANGETASLAAKGDEVPQP